MMKDFYAGKRVLVTGHTGFKGAWLCKILSHYGAEVVGYSNSDKEFPLYHIAEIERNITQSILADVRDYQTLKKVFDDFQPEIVFHLAAQPLVRESYENPVETFDVNVMGTVTVLECVRTSQSVKSFLNITTDKVYLNKEWEWGYRENEELCGYDPYSNSKSCSELVTYSYKKSFFDKTAISVSTVRSGNVIGGGDFSKDRIVPDVLLAIENNDNLVLRNPNSTRPYQHVLETLFAYLLVAYKQYDNKELEGEYNIGPRDYDSYTTEKLAKLILKTYGDTECQIEVCKTELHEATFLKLDCSKINRVLNWSPCWDIPYAVEKICEWHKCYLEGGNIHACMLSQIKEYEEKFNRRI